MFKDLFTNDKSKLRFELISGILKNSNGKFLLGDKVSCFLLHIFDTNYNKKHIYF